MEGFMKKLMVAATAIAAVLASAPAVAATLDFDFTFSNVVGTIGGNAFSGTVTGEIVGLVNNTTSSATALYIDSYPAGLGALGTVPIDVPLPSAADNRFTVSGGVLSGVYFVVAASLLSPPLLSPPFRFY
jgi:hypothetical protein